MLVLSRMLNETVVLEAPEWGYRIELVVVEIRGDKVRLGVAAPGNVVIWRNELGEFRALRCEHGIKDGEWCEDCNKAYKEAAREVECEEAG
jgi:carbon storage regulator CsrA